MYVLLLRQVLNTNYKKLKRRVTETESIRYAQQTSILTAAPLPDQESKKRVRVLLVVEKAAEHVLSKLLEGGQLCSSEVQALTLWPTRSTTFFLLAELLFGRSSDTQRSLMDAYPYIRLLTQKKGLEQPQFGYSRTLTQIYREECLYSGQMNLLCCDQAMPVA